MNQTKIILGIITLLVIAGLIYNYTKPKPIITTASIFANDYQNALDFGFIKPVVGLNANPTAAASTTINSSELVRIINADYSVVAEDKAKIMTVLSPATLTFAVDGNYFLATHTDPVSVVSNNTTLQILVGGAGYYSVQILNGALTIL